MSSCHFDVPNVNSPSIRGTTGERSRCGTNAVPVTADWTNVLSKSCPRFGSLSHHSFFSRHNPHPNRVRHIQGLNGRPICTVRDDWFVTSSLFPHPLLKSHVRRAAQPAFTLQNAQNMSGGNQSALFPEAWREELKELAAKVRLSSQEKKAKEVPSEDQLVRSRTQYSAATGRIIPHTKSSWRRSHTSHLKYPLPFQDQELMVLELLCQILQTDSLSSVQQWLLLAGQREKDLVMGMLRQALDSIDLSGRHQQNLQQLQALHAGASPPGFISSFNQPWRKTRQTSSHHMDQPSANSKPGNESIVKAYRTEGRMDPIIFSGSYLSRVSFTGCIKPYTHFSCFAVTAEGNMLPAVVKLCCGISYPHLRSMAGLQRRAVAVIGQEISHLQQRAQIQHHFRPRTGLRVNEPRPDETKPGKENLLFYVQQGQEAMRKALSMLEDKDGWKVEIAESNGDVISSKVMPGGRKVFRLEAVLEASMDELYDILFVRMEEMHRWNPSIQHIKILKHAGAQTVVTHEVSAGTAGNLIGQRDFLSVRHSCKLKSGVYLGGAAIELDSFPPQAGYVRAEDGPTCIVIKAFDENATRTHFTWLLNMDVKGWLPKSIVNQALPRAQLDFTKHLRRQLTQTA